MKKNRWTRLLSLLLAVVLCVELLPAVGSAVSPSEDLEHTVEGTVEEPAEVAFEEASLRGERVKHTRSTAKRSKRRSCSTKRRPAISFLSCCKRAI